MILGEPNNKTEFLMSKEKQALNSIQLHFAISSESHIKISPEQFFSAIKIALLYCDIPSTHKGYIIEKLNLETFSDKTELINILEDRFAKLMNVNSFVTPSYMVDGGLRVKQYY